jgi:hypothetical protein
MRIDNGCAVGAGVGLAITCMPLRVGVLSTAGGALAGRTSWRLRCSKVIVKIAWLRLDLQATTWRAVRKATLPLKRIGVVNCQLRLR